MNQNIVVKIENFLEALEVPPGKRLEPLIIKQSSRGTSIRIEITDITDGKTLEEKNFELYASQYGLMAKHLGAKFRSGSDIYVVTGLKTSRPKFPINAMRVRDGRKYKFTASFVLLNLK